MSATNTTNTTAHHHHQHQHHSQAQIGIAVQGATDAARGASDIILTEPGLTPIYTAVVESRRIYQRLRSYVLYRLSATVQIVTLLSILIFGFDQVWCHVVNWGRCVCLCQSTYVFYFVFACF